MMRCFFGAVCVGVGILTACTPSPSGQSYHKLTGETMGTSYHITFKAPDGVAASDVQAKIDERLAQINASMSTYDPNSTISKFNTLNAGESIRIDPDFVKVLTDSRVIYDRSGHAFDPTVYPLVELWGFGSKLSVDRLQNPPSDDDIRAVRDKIGLDKVVLQDNQLSKTADGVGLDFSAIAKGYGVDVVADVLKNTYNINDFMVEIGGEVSTLGINDKGKPWTLAIDKPIIGSTTTNREIMTTVSSYGKSLSLATSGNYRNMITHDGITYSHTISPMTARPVENGTPSVTVVAETVALADGWATALSAVPYDEAARMAQANQIPALFIIKKNGDWYIQKSPAFIAFESTNATNAN